MDLAIPDADGHTRVHQKDMLSELDADDSNTTRKTPAIRALCGTCNGSPAASVDLSSSVRIAAELKLNCPSLGCCLSAAPAPNNPSSSSATGYRPCSSCPSSTRSQDRVAIMRHQVKHFTTASIAVITDRCQETGLRKYVDWSVGVNVGWSY